MDSTNDFIIRLMIFKIMLCIQLELMLQNNYCSRSIEALCQKTISTIL